MKLSLPGHRFSLVFFLIFLIASAGSLLLLCLEDSTRTLYTLGPFLFCFLCFLTLFISEIRQNQWKVYLNSEEIEVWYGKKIYRTHQLDEVVQIHRVFGYKCMYALIVISLTPTDKRARLKALNSTMSSIYSRDNSMILLHMTEDEFASVKKLFSSVCPVEEEHRFW